jgi:hypothetical protein
VARGPRSRLKGNRGVVAFAYRAFRDIERGRCGESQHLGSRGVRVGDANVLGLQILLYALQTTLATHP